MHRSPGSNRHLDNLRVAASVAIILVICVLPTGDPDLHPFRTCLLCSERGALSGFLLNIAIYVPLGFSLRARSSSAVTTVALCMAMTGAVEIAQLVIPGRFSALEDLIANSAGGLLGSVLQPRFARLLFPAPTLGNALAGGWSAVATAGILVPVVLLTPAVPTGPLFGQRTPALGGRPPYDGRVVSATVESMSVPNGAIDDSDRVAAALRGPHRTRLVFVAGAATSYDAPVIRVVGEERLDYPEVFVIAIDRDDLLLRVRYRSDELNLDRPDFRIRHALAGRTPGDTITVDVTADERGPSSIAIDGAEPIGLHHTAARGWSALVYPSRFAEWQLGATDLAWLALLALPMGWWAGGLGAVFALVPMTALLTTSRGALAGPTLLFLVSITAGLAVGRIARVTFEKERAT